MKQKALLELTDVKTIATAAETEAEENRWAVSIAVVDDGGHLLWLERLDDAPPNSAKIAEAKARTAALGRSESPSYEQAIDGRDLTAFLSVPDLHGLLEGGVPILHDGQCVGAIGVSGVEPAQDAQVAQAGAAALST